MLEIRKIPFDVTVMSGNPFFSHLNLRLLVCMSYRGNPS